MVLDSESADEGDGKPLDTQSTKSAQAKKSAVPQLEASPHTPDVSSAGASTATSPVPVTPSPLYDFFTFQVACCGNANSASATGLPLPKAAPLIVQATDEFIDQLISKLPAMLKQSLGEKNRTFSSFLLFLLFLVF
jgi:polyadenylate-binding protein